MLSTNIKEATKAEHQNLEKQVVLKLKAIRSNADYADLLKHFYAYFNHIEASIKPYITESILPDYAQRRNSSYIKADILELGGDITDLPYTTVPKIENAVQALGALYVLEGSIMGGSIIVKMLEKGGVTQGVSFFSGYGEATGMMWGNFVAVLNAQAKTEQDEEEAIVAANETFKHFVYVFEKERIGTV
ncbi:biliverdin-producing heme oxygenase [Pedobacter miscanthi]|uniref:Heme oxygenase n=1 Tax=Pedobacter miscanthi TaxID=2259170 RepID=A0A366KP01_9SPHI|nr:biliverdin-producing heme oxygenase [Pedobacter miscanthi]RBQ02512.1 heme oxygenase [Pedobacter miscanthi]